MFSVAPPQLIKSMTIIKSSQLLLFNSQFSRFIMIRNIANLCSKKPFTPNFTKYRNSDENKRFSMRITSTTTIMNGFGKDCVNR